MGTNHLKRSIISQSQEKKTLHIDKDVAILESINDEGNDKPIFISHKYLQHKFQCFADWEKKEMNDYWGFNDTLHTMTWQNVFAQGGKKNKTGLGYTVIKRNVYPDSDFKRKLSQEITLFELRVNEKARVHGFRMRSIFFLCWLDRNHDITGS